MQFDVFFFLECGIASFPYISVNIMSSPCTRYRTPKHALSTYMYLVPINRNMHYIATVMITLKKKTSGAHGQPCSGKRNNRQWLTWWPTSANHRVCRFCADVHFNEFICPKVEMEGLIDVRALAFTLMSFKSSIPNSHLDAYQLITMFISQNSNHTPRVVLG